MGTYSARAPRPNGGSKKTMSNGRGGERRYRAAPISTTWPLLAPPKRISCSCRAREAATACSTNTSSFAPRERASSPSAPEPANRSRHRAPAMWCCSQLNKVSRTRSGVGLRPGTSGKFTRRPRQPPPMIRTELRPPEAFDTVLRVVTPGIIPAMTNEADTSKVRGFFKRLRAKLNQGPAWLTTDITELLPGRKIDAEILDDLETRLITADVGVEASSRILEELRRRVARKELNDVDALLKALQEAMVQILGPVERALVVDAKAKPFVILVVGINGAGKTTTIGKLAHRLLAEGKSVMLAAGDTFRAAAREQLEIWAERNNVPIIAQQSGAEPAAVIFDALKAAKARNIDVLIADTAGRLHTQTHLMDELKKVKRVLARLDPTAPHEVLLVLDGTIGQNAVAQAEEFNKGLGVTGLVITKLDGTAKGGVVLAIAQKLKIPIRFVGVGEQSEDFGVFNASEFVSALLKSDGDATVREADLGEVNLRDA